MSSAGTGPDVKAQLDIRGSRLPTLLQCTSRKLSGWRSAGTGSAAAQNIWYLQDLNTVIIDELFPGLLTQRASDWLAHPGPGRRADEVAEFYFVHR